MRFKRMSNEEIKAKLSSVLGKLHVIHGEAGLLVNFKDDPHLYPAERGAVIRDARLEAHELICDALSLLDSQAAGDKSFFGPCVSCGHNNFDTERGECKQRWMEGRMSVVCGCPCAKHNSLTRARQEERRAALRDATTIANGVQNENDLDDGGFFEAGFIAARTKIVDALIEVAENKEGSNHE